MRRAQLLTLDAMLSLILVVFILATVTNTSSALKEEISSMIEWQERANIADNMLDVLTKTQGVPENWEDNVSALVIPGLGSGNGADYVDYTKLMTLVNGVEHNNTQVIGSLWNLSSHNNFQLSFGLMRPSLYLSYSMSPNVLGHILSICSVEDLGSSSDSPVMINASSCNGGEFKFTHSGVNYDSYTNPYYVCVYGDTSIGDNFRVYLGQYLAVNGSLDVGSDGWLNASALYVTGDAYVGSNGHATTITDDSYIGGDFVVTSDGHASFDKNLYVYGSTTVESSGYLTVGRNMYSLKGIRVESNGNLNVSGSLYSGSDSTIGNSAHLWVGDNMYFNGSLNGQSSLNIYAGGDTVINGDLSLPSGNLEVGGDLYVNGDFTQNPTTTVDVGGDTFINGSLTVEGSNVFHGDLRVNGDLTVDWGKELTVYGDLYVAGKLTIRGTLVVYGNIYEYDTQEPPIEIASGKTLDVNGWVYGYSYNMDTWYAIKGTGYDTDNYDFSGYKYVGGKSPWEYMSVEIDSNEVTLGDLVSFRRIKIFIEEFSIFQINSNFNIQINGTGSLASPPSKDDAFSWETPALRSLMPLPPEFSYPECLSKESSSSLPLRINVSEFNVSYEFPSIASTKNITFAIINGSLVTDPGTVNDSRYSSRWVEYSEAKVVVVQRKYAQEYHISGGLPRIIYAGLFDQYLSDSIAVILPSTSNDGRISLVSVFTHGDTTGYSVVGILRNNSNILVGVNMTLFRSGSSFSLVPESCRVEISGNTAILPLDCFIPQATLGKQTSFTIWVYDSTFSRVDIQDTGSMGAYLKPVYVPGVISLWVWPRR